jgi:hypothetical protein
MLKFLLPLSLVSALGFFGWKHIDRPVEVSAEERIAAIRSQAACTAIELGEFAESHPGLVEKELKGRLISVTGVLSRGLVTGVTSSDLLLELEGSQNMKIDFQSDFERFTRMGDGWQRGRFKFQKFGHEIVLFQSPSKPGNNRASSEEGDFGGKKSANIEPVVKFREGDRYTLKGVFQHVGNRRVRIQLREMP